METRDDFELLKDMIQRERGFNCKNYKDTTLKRRINVRMKVNNVQSYGEYIRLLINNKREYDKLVDVLTINFTEFFRDKEMFDLLREEIFPELIDRKKREGKKVISIWSAGCAAGEEPYSIAIILQELLGDDMKNFVVAIKATDIDEKCLGDAVRGLYEKDLLKNVGVELLEKYFDKVCDYYRLRDSIKSMVKFEKSDLINGKPQHYVDVIFCRNVFIYFSRDTQKEIFEAFYDSLAKEGYLVIGKTETMHEAMHKKFNLVSLSERIFRKVS
ncbi:MAG: protein-glutamate O-methyltransferase CheR [Candidatus Altiarchaeota archaeon]|nr:protein-glutamate O-methyltransferase CheR [Candidatus Altiarchaeota archaeon]